MQEELYLNLLKKVLIDYHRDSTQYKPIARDYARGWRKILVNIDAILRRKNHAICKVIDFSSAERNEGKDWPQYAETMVGLKRLENIEYCMRTVTNDKIPGDFIETGVWRGGVTIFMRAFLKALNIDDRNVWVADSFEGLPKPDSGKYIADTGDKHHENKELAISLDQVKANFRKYDLLDDKVKFLKGWFKDTLPNAPMSKLAIIRLDGDMYESTMDGLTHLYPKLEKGGFLIVDDWGAVPACKQAVLDYRKAEGINDTINAIDWTGVYWRKT